MSALGYYDPSNLSPPLQAVIEDNVEGLRDLLQGDTSVNLVDKGKNTLLHVAVKDRKRKVFDYLLTVDDICLDVVNSEGFTPLMYAIVLEDEYYALRLLENEVEVNPKSEFKITPLHLAAEGDNEAILEALIEHGAYIDRQDVFGATPLHIACRYNSSLIHLLLYYGANTNIENCKQETPFGLGLLYCPFEVQEILYNYTYDNLTTEMIDIKTLTATLKKDSPFLYKWIQRNHVDDNRKNSKFLTANMDRIRPKRFTTFMDWCDNITENFFRDSSLDTQHFPHLLEGYLNLFYMLCDNHFIDKLYIGPNWNVVIVYHFLFDSEENSIRFICCLYSYGFRTSMWMLCHIYWKYYYGKLFSILLHMELDRATSYEKMLRAWPCFVVPALIQDFNLSIDVLYEIKDRGSWYFDELRKLFKHPVLVEHERAHNKGEVHISLVPSLLQLARESCRKFLIQRFKIKTSVQFFTMLKALPIAQVYKDILSYKRSIYPVAENVSCEDSK